MKSPAFQWYAADYLADERVMLLSLESEAVYVRLLNYCWREGSIPAKPELCVPMCKYADVKVIKPALGLFIKSPTLPGRLIHKRLEEERSKQEAFREKQAENGRRGGRPRKANDNPEETQAKGLGFSGETQTKPKKSSSSSTSSSNSSSSLQSEEPSSLRSEVVPSEDEQLAADLDYFNALTPDGEEQPPKSPDAWAPHTEGAADVPTQFAKPKPAPRKQQLTPDQIAAAVGFAHPGEEFRGLWLTFLAGTKQKGKQLSAFELMNKKLGKYPEAFAVVMLERAIQGNWSGVENDGTPRAYAEWQAAQQPQAPELTIYRNPHNAGLGTGGTQVSQVAARTQQAHSMMNAYEYDEQGNRLGRRL